MDTPSNIEKRVVNIMLIFWALVLITLIAS